MVNKREPVCVRCLLRHVHARTQAVSQRGEKGGGRRGFFSGLQLVFHPAGAAAAWLFGETIETDTTTFPVACAPTRTVATFPIAKKEVARKFAIFNFFLVAPLPAL